MKMPSMKPIRIPTKDVNCFKRVWRWFTVIRKWEITERYYYLHKGVQLVIPAGFIFDGASIPRVFWTILSPTGLLLIPGLFHDYGYRYNYLISLECYHGVSCEDKRWHEGAGKAFWDKLFREMGEEVNGVHFANWVAWAALGVGGWAAWFNKRKVPDPVPPLRDRGEEL